MEGDRNKKKRIDMEINEGRDFGINEDWWSNIEGNGNNKNMDIKEKNVD